MDASGRGREQGAAATAPARDETLEHPRCVFQILKRHFARYTPEMVEETCGVPRDLFLEVAEALCDNSGRERTSAFCYAVGWTQHTVGVQYIRTGRDHPAAARQHRPARRRHPGPAGPRQHPGLDRHPDALTTSCPATSRCRTPIRTRTATGTSKTTLRRPAGFWGHAPAYIVSLLKAWWGDAATADNDFCFDYLPRITGDHSTYQSALDMLDGKVKGYFLLGENPAVGSANGKLQRLGHGQPRLAGRARPRGDRERQPSGTTAPRSRRASCAPRTSAPRCSSCRPPPTPRRTARFTNTQRLLQWHHKAVEPPGDCRSELWFYYHLGRIIREKLAASTDPRDRPLLDLTWDYPTSGDADESRAPTPSCRRSAASTAGGAALVVQRAEGRRLDGVRLLDLQRLLRRRRQPDRPPQARPRADLGGARVGLGVAGEPAHPLQPGVGRPDRQAWSERKRYVWWDDDGRGGRARTSPTSSPTSAPTTCRRRCTRRRGPARATTRSSCRPTARAGSSRRRASSTGRCRPTTSRTSRRCATRCTASRRTRRARSSTAENKTNPSAGGPGADVYPYVFTTYRLTEHHTAGGMSRTLPYLSELQPEFFCEVSPRWPPSATSSTRRLGDDHHRAHRHRGAGARDRADQAADRRRPHDPPGRPALPLGHPRARRRATRPTTCCRSPSTPTCTSRRQGGHLRHPARPPAAGTQAWRVRRPPTPGRHLVTTSGPEPHGLLHRHLAVHRLQGVRGGLQGVEPRPRGRPGLPRHVLRQHRRARRQHVAPRGLHRADKPSRGWTRTTTATSAG